MNPFEELQPPLPEQVFEDFKGKWFIGHVPPQGNAMRFLLREKAELETYVFPGGDPDPIIEKFYFDTVCEAHERAIEYYAKYSEDYPYMRSYLQQGGTTERANKIVGDTSNDNVESQVMVFV